MSQKWSGTTTVSQCIEQLCLLQNTNREGFKMPKRVPTHDYSKPLDLSASFLGSRSKRKVFWEDQQPFIFKAEIFYNNKIDKAMKKQRSSGSSHKKYTKISTKRRQDLVEKVEKQGQPVAKVAKALRINISTAKLILKKYKETGTFFNKRMCKTKPRARKTSEKAIIKEELPSVSLENGCLEEVAPPTMDSSEGTDLGNVYNYWYPVHYFPFPQMFQFQY